MNPLGVGEKSDRPCILDKNKITTITSDGCTECLSAYQVWFFQVLSRKPVLKMNKIVQRAQLSFSGLVKCTTGNNGRFCLSRANEMQLGLNLRISVHFKLFLQNKTLWFTFVIISQINLMHFSSSKQHDRVGSVLILEEYGGRLKLRAVRTSYVLKHPPSSTRCFSSVRWQKSPEWDSTCEVSGKVACDRCLINIISLPNYFFGSNEPYAHKLNSFTF